MTLNRRRNAVLLLWALASAWIVFTCVRTAKPIERALEWPQFERSAEEVRATQARAIATAEHALDVILAQSPEQLTFQSTLVARDALLHEYAKHWNRMDLLQNVSPDPQLREAASAATIALEQWYVEHIMLSQQLHALIERFAATEEAARLHGEDLLLLQDVLAEYRRSGLQLSPEHRAPIAAGFSRLAELAVQIGLEINAAEGIVAFEREALEGLSDEQLQTLERDASTGRYLVRTSLRSQYELVMEHAASRVTRQRTLSANLSRAMDENAAAILEVLQLRTQLAELLGYETWADYQIEPRMAETAEVAERFILDLDEALEPSFATEQAQLKELAQADSSLGLEDIAYYLDMLLERDYAIDTEVVRQYFAERALLRRIFDICEETFALEITLEEPPQRWAEDLEVALIADADSGRLLGAIYLDLHPRSGKYTHFATFDVVGGRRLTARRYQAPICAIVGNFPVAVGEQPALWSFDDVGTFLHELGHALHCVLTEAAYHEHAGLNVPLDYVEVPSQTLERWLQDPALLARMAVHHQTGEAMPDALIERLTSTAYVGVGHDYSRQIGFGLIDFEIHTYESADEVPDSAARVYADTNAVFGEHYYDVPEHSALLASFGHLFEGYDGGYYSYAWSDAIAADIASLFRESELGFADPQLGARFRAEVLATGSSRSAHASIRAFLGRDWSLDAFFEELGGAASGSP
ncbi:MAG TPA: M3 family metallopeptidase [Enhygromyxa sp.]|nr:M3 family metallopeptidase [Enhygromyxa sp.]